MSNFDPLAPLRLGRLWLLALVALPLTWLARYCFAPSWSPFLPGWSPRTAPTLVFAEALVIATAATGLWLFERGPSSVVGRVRVRVFEVAYIALERLFGPALVAGAVGGACFVWLTRHVGARRIPTLGEAVVAVAGLGLLAGAVAALIAATWGLFGILVLALARQRQRVAKPTQTARLALDNAAALLSYPFARDGSDRARRASACMRLELAAWAAESDARFGAGADRQTARQRRATMRAVAAAFRAVKHPVRNGDEGARDAIRTALLESAQRLADEDWRGAALVVESVPGISARSGPPGRLGRASHTGRADVRAHVALRGPQLVKLVAIAVGVTTCSVRGSRDVPERLIAFVQHGPGTTPAQPGQRSGVAAVLTDVSGSAVAFGVASMALTYLLAHWASLSQHRVPDSSGHRGARPRPMNSEATHARVLMFLSDPTDSTPLQQLQDEARAVERELKATAYRDRISLRTCLAARPEDLVEYLRSDRPVAVHFSGHGSPAGIVLRLADGTGRAVAGHLLRRVFEAHNVRIVVLNACYSEHQARILQQVVPVVIGTTAAVSDQAARDFSTAFYRGLGNGRTVAEASHDARVIAQLHGFRDVYQELGDVGVRLVEP